MDSSLYIIPFVEYADSDSDKWKKPVYMTMRMSS